MGTDRLIARNGGQTTDAAWWNLFKTVLSDALVPRDNTGTALDQFGKLGSSTYRWKDLYVNKLILNTIASGLNFQDSSGSLIAQVNNTTKLNIHPTNGMDGQYFKADSVSRGALATQTILKTSSSGVWTGAAGAREQPTNLSGSLTTNGNPVFIGLTTASESGVDTGAIDTNEAGKINFWFVRGGTDLVQIAHTFAIETIPASAFFFIETGLAAGTYTYSIECQHSSGTGTVSFVRVVLIAWEL